MKVNPGRSRFIYTAFVQCALSTASMLFLVVVVLLLFFFVVGVGGCILAGAEILKVIHMGSEGRLYLSKSTNGGKGFKNSKIKYYFIP